MPHDTDSPSPGRGPDARRWRALLVFGLVLVALTAIGIVLLGDRLFDLDFSP